MSSEPRFNGVMLVNRLDNLGMLRGRPVLERTLQALHPNIRRAYRDRRLVSQRWLPMTWLIELHEAIEQATGAGSTLSRQLGYFGTRQSFGTVGTAIAGFSSPRHLFRMSSRIFHVYYKHGKMSVLRAEAQMVVVRWDDCTQFDAHNWQVTFGSCQAMLELAHARNPHIEVVSGGNEGDNFAEAMALWQ